MKQLKDYLHLYFGCEGVIHFLKPSLLQRDYSNGDTIWLGTNELYDVLTDKATFKPILRPLSDMIYEEKKFLKINIIQAIALDKPNEAVMWTFEQTRWLLSKHFDLFGLIESGLAIDKTKMQLGRMIANRPNSPLKDLVLPQKQ